jgi:hypothetical protein
MTSPIIAAGIEQSRKRGRSGGIDFWISLLNVRGQQLVHAGADEPRRNRENARKGDVLKAERSATLPGPPAGTLKLGKAGGRPRSASAAG